MIRAVLIDFDDSFTWNIVQELEEVGFKTEVVHWRDFESLTDHDLLILGPGPGHPDDYQRIYPLLQEWLKEGLPFFGVCLGHQIFWRLQGEDIVRSKLPCHGQKVKLALTDEWKTFLKLGNEVHVQRYNSLAVPVQSSMRVRQFQNFIHEDEIFMTRGNNILTYQFHPESVGTSFRKAFFMPLKLYLV